MTEFKRKIRKQFGTGLVVILPIGLTLWVIWLIFRFVGNRILPLVENIPQAARFPPQAQLLISVAGTLLIIWLIGLWAHNFAGRFFLAKLESLVLKAPLISKIYSTMKQLTNTMLVSRQAFKKVAVIEYPRKGIRTLVFITNENAGNRVDSNWTTVFVPSTPNPTTGFCIMLPDEEVYELDISVNQAIEFIFSGGIIVPEGLDIPGLLKSDKVKEEE